AARIKFFSSSALLARLERRLPLLTGGARDLPARQQTLRDTIAWSYDLLEQTEQWLFHRLAVFAGGCTLEAAETLCSECGFQVLDLLASLVDKSLLRNEEGGDGEPRFSMLETVREYAWEKLREVGEAERVQWRHLEYFLQLAEEAEPELEATQQVTRLEQ